MGVGGERLEARVQILPTDRGWQEAACHRGIEVEEADRRGRADDVVCRGELKCTGGGGKIANGIWSARSAPTWSWKLKNNRRTGALLKKRGMRRSRRLETWHW